MSKFIIQLICFYINYRFLNSSTKNFFTSICIKNKFPTISIKLLRDLVIAITIWAFLIHPCFEEGANYWFLHSILWIRFSNTCSTLNIRNRLHSTEIHLLSNFRKSMVCIFMKIYAYFQYKIIKICKLIFQLKIRIKYNMATESVHRMFPDVTCCFSYFSWLG